jgi:hypothetical protein
MFKIIFLSSYCQLGQGWFIMDEDSDLGRFLGFVLAKAPVL